MDECLVERPAAIRQSSPGPGNDIDAAITNLFGMHNRMHDFAYYLGFDEPHWNAQQYNHGLGGVATTACSATRKRLRSAAAHRTTTAATTRT